MNTITALDTKALHIAMATQGIRSLRALAKLSAVSPSYLQHVARGLTPSAEMQRRISDALGTMPDKLWVAVAP